MSCFASRKIPGMTPQRGVALSLQIPVFLLLLLSLLQLGTIHDLTTSKSQKPPSKELGSSPSSSTLLLLSSPNPDHENKSGLSSDSESLNRPVSFIKSSSSEGSVATSTKVSDQNSQQNKNVAVLVEVPCDELVSGNITSQTGTNNLCVFYGNRFYSHSERINSKLTLVPTEQQKMSQRFYNRCILFGRFNTVEVVESPLSDLNQKLENPVFHLRNGKTVWKHVGGKSRKAAVLIFADEKGDFDTSFASEAAFALRHYIQKGKVNSMWIPSGFERKEMWWKGDSNTGPCPHRNEIRLASKRQSFFNFMGSMRGSRKKMMNVLQNRYSVGTQPGSRYFVRILPVYNGQQTSEYFHVIQNSALTLCPCGNNAESHRVWESLFHGSIPVVEQCDKVHSGKDFANLIRREIPDIPIVAEWVDLLPLLHSLENNKEILDRLQRSVYVAFYRFWHKIGMEVGNQAIAAWNLAPITLLPNDVPKQVALTPFAAAAQAAASSDGVILYTVGTKDYLDLINNFYLTAIRPFGLKNFLFVALSQGMCDDGLLHADIRCVTHGRKVTAGGVFDSPHFADAVGAKTEVMKQILDLGYVAWLSDCDIHFLMNPLPRLLSEMSELTIQDDDVGGRNSGFMFVRPTKNSKAFVNNVLAAQQHGTVRQQVAVNQVLRKQKNSLSVRVLSTGEWPCGKAFFGTTRMFAFNPLCEKCFLFHNNWIVGFHAKQYRAMEFLQWAVDTNGYYSSSSAQYLTLGNPDGQVSEGIEMEALKSGFLIARQLNRVVLLPWLRCKGKVGSICALNARYYVKRWRTLLPAWREMMFRYNPLVPSDVRLGTNIPAYTKWASTMPNGVLPVNQGLLSLEHAKEPQHVLVSKLEGRTISSGSDNQVRLRI